MSSQAQAFVPAHTAYPHLRNAALSGRGGRPAYAQNAPVMYGAHGQPLSAIPGQAAYVAAPPPPGEAGAAEHMGAAYPPQPLPLAVPHSAATGPGRGGVPGRRSSSTDRQFLDASGGSPSSSSTASYAAPPPPYAHPPPPLVPGSAAAAPSSATSSSSAYYADPGRTPPQSYGFERSSSSPRDSSAVAPGSYPFPPLHPPLAMPMHAPGGSGGDGTPPPPHSAHPPPPPPRQGPEDRRAGMSIQNMLDQAPAQGPAGPGGRSATDYEMLDALMPRRRL